LDLAEGIGNLHQTAELYCAREVTRRPHDEGKHHGRLIVAHSEKGQELLSLHDRPPVVYHRRETSAESAQFVFLAPIQGDILAVLAEAYQIEAKVGLISLLVKVERDKRFTDLVREPGADNSVADGHPNHIAVNDISRATQWNFEGPG
jgi:hypothetical protein